MTPNRRSVLGGLASSIILPVSAGAQSSASLREALDAADVQITVC